MDIVTALVKNITRPSIMSGLSSLPQPTFDASSASAAMIVGSLVADSAGNVGSVVFKGIFFLSHPSFVPRAYLRI